MKFVSTKTVEFPGHYYFPNTELDIDLERKWSYIEVSSGNGLCITLGNTHHNNLFPINVLKPKEPYDVETTDLLLDLLKEIQKYGKILFISPSIQGNENSVFQEWREADNYYVFSYEELMDIKNDILTRFKRNVFSSVIREAVKELPDVDAYRVERAPKGDSGFVLTKYESDGESVFYSFTCDSIAEVFDFFAWG